MIRGSRVRSCVENVETKLVEDKQIGIGVVEGLKVSQRPMIGEATRWNSCSDRESRLRRRPVTRMAPGRSVVFEYVGCCGTATPRADGLEPTCDGMRSTELGSHLDVDGSPGEMRQAAAETVAVIASNSVSEAQPPFAKTAVREAGREGLDRRTQPPRMGP